MQNRQTLASKYEVGGDQKFEPTSIDKYDISPKIFWRVVKCIRKHLFKRGLPNIFCLGLNI